MSNYIPFTCARCRRTLHVRAAYLGRWVTCNHCDHSFIAQEFDAGTVPTSSAEIPIPGEFQAVKDENARLVATVRVLKSELVECMAEVERLRRSAEDLIVVRAERDQGEEERRAAVALAEQLRARLDEVRRTCEEAEAQIDALRSELSEVRAGRDTAIALAERLRTERDRCEEREGQWERTLGENECRHRTEIDTLAHELRKARQQAGLALQHEGELGERLQVVQDELDQLRRGLEAERRGHLEQSTLLAGELETMFREQLAAERDRAYEQAEALRREIDRLSAAFADAEARNVADDDLQRAERAELTRALEEAWHKADREAELEGQVRRLQAELDRQRGVVVTEQAAVERRASDADAVRPQAPDRTEVHARTASGCPGPAAHDGPENPTGRPGTLPPPPSEGRGERAEGDAPARPGSVADASPEERIRSLRNDLRAAHEARTRGRGNRPFFTRLARIWKKSDSPS